MNTQPPPIPAQKTNSPGALVSKGIGLVFGIVVGRYCGIHLLIPLLSAFGVGWLLTKIPASPTAFRVAWAVQAGHAVWMAFGGVVTGAWSQVILDILIIVAGLVWLWARPGLGPVILLGLYQLVAGAVNVVMLVGAETGSLQHKALVAHVCFRVAALASMIAAYIKTQKQQSENQGS